MSYGSAYYQRKGSTTRRMRARDLASFRWDPSNRHPFVESDLNRQCALCARRRVHPYHIEERYW